MSSEAERAYEGWALLRSWGISGAPAMCAKSISMA